MVWILDAQYCLKTECFHSDFKHCLKSELFDNRTIIDAPKSELIRISVLYCTIILAVRLHTIKLVSVTFSQSMFALKHNEFYRKLNLKYPTHT